VSATARLGAEYAEVVRRASEEELRAGLAVNRDAILEGIFTAMPEYLDAAAAAKADLVVEWRITGSQDGGFDSWQVTVSNGACVVQRNGSARPQAIVTVGAVEFVRLAAGAITGPQLFTFGGLQVEADLLAAARLDAFFLSPGEGAR
jgi:hypothetical protein